MDNIYTPSDYNGRLGELKWQEHPAQERKILR